MAAETTKAAQEIDYFGRHMRVGWWSLLLFVVLGATLETLHGFKIGWYLDVGNEVRRLMWTLAHAHGALLSLVNIAFALALRSGSLDTARVARASRLLVAATVLLPGGFFAGGFFIHAGDPGLGVILVPVGAALLALAVAIVARGFARETRGGACPRG